MKRAAGYDYVQGFSAEEILCCALLFRGEG
jgi:hypothetical protein